MSADRADRIRLNLGLCYHDLLPPGSVCLTADEHAALIRAGDVLATRLDETPAWPSRQVKPKQRAVREWLAIAHPNGEGHPE